MTNQIPMIAVAALLLLMAASSVECQFLQPQSHLGRLVQSITSPLVLAASSSGDSEGSTDSYGEPASGYYSQAGQDDTGASSGEPSHRPLGSPQQAPAVHLQQAPTNQRGIPQHYYGTGFHHSAYQQQGGSEDRGAPSNNRGNQQEYAMGAYLGPTIDDKEINGAFNSNDDRDDDDGPASYDGAEGGAKYKAASNAYGDSPAGGYGPEAGSTAPQGYGYDGGRQNVDSEANYYGPSRAAEAANEDDGADEDEGPRGSQRPRGGRQYRGLSQAASQYQQQYGAGRHGGGSNRQSGGQQMVAAANGYAPYGYVNGPVDLSSIMAGMAGANPNSGFEVYNGDGSYPPGYGPGQQSRGGRRNQAASMNQNGYYSPDGSQGSQGGNGQHSNNNDDDQDMNDDDD